MVYWFYNRKDLKATPSAQDAIAPETEMRYRKEGARFIMDLGNKIGLRYDTVATGVVFMHRFYMFHSFKEFDRYVTACCCLFLAGKVEETPKKCKDIIKVAKTLLPDSKFLAFGTDPKEEVMTMERILLQTIKFDLQVDHPYTYLIKYAKCLKGDKVKLHKCVQMAWTFVNDSLCTTLSLQWEPEIIAIALMYLAGKLSKFEVVDWVGRQPHHLRWWDMFVEDISMELLEDICHQVLDLYTQAKVASVAADSPPQTAAPAPAAAAAATAAAATATPKQEPQSADPSTPGLAPPSAEVTPKKEYRKSAPSTPPGAQPKTEPPAPAAAAPAAAASGGQPQFGGFGYGPPPAAGYGYMYPPPAGGAAPPPPPPPAAPPGPAAAAPAAPFPPQYPPFGFPPTPTENKAPSVPPPPPPPAAKYPPPPPPSASVPPPPPPSSAPPPPPPPHPHPPYPPGPSGGPPPRGYFPPQGGPPPGFRPPGPGFPPGHRPF